MGVGHAICIPEYSRSARLHRTGMSGINYAGFPTNCGDGAENNGWWWGVSAAQLNGRSAIARQVGRPLMLREVVSWY